MVQSSKMYIGKNLSPLPLSQPPYFLSWDTTYVFSFSYILSARDDTYRIKYIYTYTYVQTFLSLTAFTFLKKQMAMYIIYIILLLAFFA